jgi:hypothetical protein
MTAILLILMLLFCGCQKQYPPDEVKTIVAENFELLKEAADLTISKNLSFPISMYELKEVDNLTKEELEVFKKCQEIGIRDLYYSNRMDNNGNKIYNDNHYYLLFDFYYEPKCQSILYIPPHSDFETPEEAILYNQPFIDENDIEEVIELDENWYYYRCKW